MEQALQGWVCHCSLGFPGLVTSATPVEVTYADGNTGRAWTGIHLSPELFGQPWSSRNPKPFYPAYDPLRTAERF